MICSIWAKFYTSSAVFRSAKLKYIMYWTKQPVPSNSSPIPSIWPSSHINHYWRAFIPGFQSQKSRGIKRVISLWEKQNTSQRNSLRKENWRNTQLQKPKCLHIIVLHICKKSEKSQKSEIPKSQRQDNEPESFRTRPGTGWISYKCQLQVWQDTGAWSSFNLYLNLQVFSSTTTEICLSPFPKDILVAFVSFNFGKEKKNN